MSNNSLIYRLMMQDGMTPILKKIGVSTDHTTDKVNSLSSSAGGLNNISLSGFLSSMTKIAGVLGIGATIGKAIKDGMEQETRNTSLEVLLGGVDNAKKMIDDISGYAAKSPYGKAGLSEAVQMMSGFGIAQEKIMPNLRAIGDIAMGDEQKFQSLSLAFSQMSSAGKLMGQDLMQMINAGFNPLEQMSKTTGKNISQLKDEMSKGLITSEMVTKAFQDATSEGGKYNGMIEKISGTASGQWATAMDNISEMMLNLYSQVIQPILLPALKTVNKFFEDNAEKISNAMGIVGEFVGSAYEKVSDMFSRISQNASLIEGVFKPLLNIVKDVFKTFGDWYDIISGADWSGYFAPVVDVLQNYLVPMFQSIWGTIKSIVGQVIEFIANSEILRDLFSGIMNFAKILYSTITWVVDKLKWLFDNVVMPILNALEKAYRLIKGKKNLNVVVGGQPKTISAPVVPGIATIAGTAEATGVAKTGTEAGNNSTAKSTATAIATGGQKTTNITINLKDLVQTINISRDGFVESVEDMRDVVLEELTRLLAMSQGMAV